MKGRNFTGGWRKRPKEATPQKALELKRMGLTLKEISKMWDISSQQIYNLLEQAKLSRMTPEQKHLSRALDCQEWLRQYIQGKYEGKILRRLNLHLREIKSQLEKWIPCKTNGSESAGKNLVESAQKTTGAPSEQTGKSLAA